MAWRLRVGGRVTLLLYPGLTGMPDSVVALIRDESCSVIVDSGSGSPWSNSALTLALAAEGVRRGDVNYTVITHAHLPNAGGASFLHSALATIIAAMEPDASWIERGDPEKTAAREFKMKFTPAPVGLRLREGKLPGCDSIRILHTPGHTPGSVSVAYMDPAKGLILFVGDAMGRLSRRWGSSESDWLRSVERISSMDPRVLCTSVQCMEGEAARRFIEEVESRGPEWVDGGDRS